MPTGANRSTSRLDEDGAQALRVNGTEWLFARGEIFANGEMRNLNAHLLGRDGPWGSPAQQRWTAQMAEPPLRLWRVTQERKGQGPTLVDAIDADAQPVRVQERAGSEPATPGLLLGTRLMDVGDQFELSRATYPIERLHETAALAAVADALAAGGPPDGGP